MRSTLRWADLLFWVAASLVAVLHLVFLVAGIAFVRLWEDEAYNLTVPLNLAHGLGYASDGLLTGGGLQLFDVRISTGPVVLLPIAAILSTGIDPVTGGRMVMAVFAVILTVALFIAGRRIAGRWGGLIAAAVPLAFDASALPSPIQAPTDVLGEYPAAACAVIAFLFFSRRPALAGLFIGLALQSKNLMVLSVPVFALAVLLSGSDLAVLTRLRRLLGYLVGVAAPTLVFEGVKLLVLGPTGYWNSTRDLYYFLRTGGQQGYDIAPPEKLEVALAAWSGSWVVGLVILLVAAVTLACLLVVLRRRGERLPREAIITAGLALGTASIWMAWWALSRHDPAWIRHPAPGLLSSVPLLGAMWVRAVQELARRTRASIPRIGLALVASLVVAVAVLPQAGARIEGLAHQPYDTLPEQRAAAGVVDTFPTSELRGVWGRLPSVAFIAGRDSVLGWDPRDAWAPWLIERSDRTPGGVASTNAQVEQQCGSRREYVGIYVVCEPR